MSAIITTKNFVDRETELFVIARIRSFMAQYPGAWTLELIGSAHSVQWEVLVTAPNGAVPCLAKLYGGNNGRRIDDILADLGKVVNQSHEKA